MLKQQAVVQEICSRLAAFSDRTKMISFKKYWDFHKLLSRLTLFYCCSIQLKSKLPTYGTVDAGEVRVLIVVSGLHFVSYTQIVTSTHRCLRYGDKTQKGPNTPSRCPLYVDVCARRENIADLWRESPLTLFARTSTACLCALRVSFTLTHPHLRDSNLYRRGMESFILKNFFLRTRHECRAYMWLFFVAFNLNRGKRRIHS